MKKQITAEWLEDTHPNPYNPDIYPKPDVLYVFSDGVANYSTTQDNTSGAKFNCKVLFDNYNYVRTNEE